MNDEIHAEPEVYEAEPVLYILMRTDLASMNPGKAVSQGVHAGHQFTYQMNAADVNPDEFPKVKIETIHMYDQWVSSTDQGFGTTITLDVNVDQLFRVTIAAEEMGFFAGVTHDPSYPLQDGDFTHLIPLDTCGFVFGDKKKLEILLRQFSLMN
jgi:peptidyl-tRNA hydrolase